MREINYNGLWLKLAADFKNNGSVKLNDVLELLDEKRDIPDSACEMLSFLVKGKGKTKSDKLSFKKKLELIEMVTELEREYGLNEALEKVSLQYNISSRSVETILSEHRFFRSIAELNHPPKNKQ